MGTNWGTGSSVWTWGGTSSLWGWRSTGTVCPGRWWSLILWRYSRPAWTSSCAACCRWPCFGRRVGLDDPQRSLPTSTILLFCDSVNWNLILQHLFLLAFSRTSMFTKTDIMAITKLKSSVWGHCLNHLVDFSYSIYCCLCNRASKCIYASYNFMSLFLFWYLCCKYSSNKILCYWHTFFLFMHKA